MVSSPGSPAAGSWRSCAMPRCSSCSWRRARAGPNAASCGNSLSTSDRPDAPQRAHDVMTPHDSIERLEDVILTRIIRLNALVQGLVTGLLVGLVIFVATNWLVLKGGPVVGPHLALLGQFFIGYRVTFLGSLIGFAYAFAVGFVLGYLVGRMYNWIAGLREDKRLDHT